MNPPPLSADVAPTSSKLPLTSLICGLIGFLTGPLGGIPAIITGHIALNRIKRSGDAIQGKGLAIAGLILGYFTTFLLGFVLIMAAAGFAAGNAAIQKARKITTLNMITTFETASNGFFTDYGYLPMEGTTDAVIHTDRAPDLLHTLLGSGGGGGLNPRQVKYLQLKSGTGRKNGLIYRPDGSLIGWFDSWGNPLHVAFDLDSNEMLTVPDRSGTPLTLNGRRVAVWSDGPDGKSGTADDVATW